MLSASRILKSINRSRELFVGVRAFSLNLNENLTDNSRSRRWKNEIELLETNTRRYGRIDSMIFQQCLRKIRNEELTSKESLLLLKCCGSLMNNKTKTKRNEYLKEVWSLLKEKRVPLNIMHYNLLMKMYIENGHEFEPQTILSEINENGLEPNLRTYEFIVNKYCVDGRLDKVTELLENMNEQGLSLTAPMFDSLILGHFMNKDIKTALETFEMMKESKINVTNATYKNIVIGYLKNHESVNAVDEIKKLVHNDLVSFEIDDIGHIIEHMPKEGMSEKDAKELKQFLVERVHENENYYNELSNCCYNLILKGEYDLVRHFYDKYFHDDQSRSYFVKRMVNSILKSDETKMREFVEFLKELHPSFYFSSYAKSTLKDDQFGIQRILSVLSETASVLDNQELGVYVLFIDKCKNEDDLHALTAQYLANLNVNWINNIKQKFLPKLQTDLIRFLEEHLKRNKIEESRTLLTLSIFCTYFDQLDIDALKKITEQFRPRISLLSNKYLLDRTSELIETKMDKFPSLLVCLRHKLYDNYAFRVDFIRLCVNNVKEDAMLKYMVEYFDKHDILIPQDKLEEPYLNKLRDLFVNPIKSRIDSLKWKLVSNEPIQLNAELVALKNELPIATIKDLFVTALNNGNIQLVDFLYDSKIHLHVGHFIKYTLLKLENKENVEKTIEFLIENLANYPEQKIISLSPQVNKIFDQIKDHKKLVYLFTNSISLHLKPLDLYEHLIYFYDQTKDANIGENLITLNIFMFKNSNRNRVFGSMVKFIEGKNTSLLQLLCDRMTREMSYGKARVYQELALAFVFTQRYKQAIKVMQTKEFDLSDDLHHKIVYLQSINRAEVIKQYAILVYQEAPNLRKELLRILDASLTKLDEKTLFEEILLEIKQLNLAKQKYEKDDQTSDKMVAPQTTDERLLTKTAESRDELITLVDEIIAKKKSFKLNVECDIVDRLMSLGELEKTIDLIYDMLVNERFPIPAVIKNVLKELNKHARIDLIDRLEPHLPLPLKESEFYKSNKITTYLRTTHSEDEIVKCLKNIQVFSADLIDQILTMKSDYEPMIVTLLKEKKKTNLNYIWLHFMKNDKFDKALDLVMNNRDSLSVQNLLYQPVINLVKQSENIELAKQLIDYATKFELKSNTIQSIYSVYVKLCLSMNRVDDARNVIEQHYKSKPDLKLDLQNVDKQLINKLDESFVKQFSLSK